jgi:uncharacterized protein YggE
MKKFWHAIKNPLITAAFVLLGMFLYVNFSYALPFGYRQTNNNAMFTSDGTGEVTYTPDTALIYLSVNKTALTQESAKDQANEVINKITEELKKLGIAEKDIKTTGFSVGPNYGNEPISADAEVSTKLMIAPERPTTGKGYTASVSLEVRVKPLDKAEQAIDVATKGGATQVGTYQMVIDEAKQKELEDQARIEAIKKAKEKAKSLADAAGIRLGRVVSVQDNTGGGYPRPMLLKMDAAAESFEAAPTQLNPGENTVSVSVTLSFETY